MEALQRVRRLSNMEPAVSADGGKTWEVNWICELSR